MALKNGNACQDMETGVAEGSELPWLAAEIEVLQSRM